MRLMNSRRPKRSSWPASEREAEEWLHQRGSNGGLIDSPLSSLIDISAALQTRDPSFIANTAAAAIRDSSTLRNLRTNAHRIGNIHADSVYVAASRRITRPI